MIVGAILTRVRDHLRQALDLPDDQVDIRYAGLPPATAASPYVAIRELGVKSDGRSFLREEHQLEISLWRRATDLPDDVSADALYGDDAVLPDVATIDQLERLAIAALHGNDIAISQALNQSLGLGSGSAGDRFQLPLFYTGRKGTELSRPWLGRRLHFTGLTRVQPIDVMR